MNRRGRSTGALDEIRSSVLMRLDTLERMEPCLSEGRQFVELEKDISRKIATLRQ